MALTAELDAATAGLRTSPSTPHAIWMLLGPKDWAPCR